MAAVQPRLTQIKHSPARYFLSGAEKLNKLNNLTGNGGPSLTVKVEKAKPENASEIMELFKV